MDIFDLSFEQFEKRVDEILNNISQEELLQELVDNGLIVDSYVKYISYIEEEKNIWVHKNRTSPFEKIKSIFVNTNSKSNMTEAA